MSRAGGRAERVSERDVRQRVLNIIDCRMRGDVNGMSRHFFEDVELNYNCAKIGLFPSGHWRGREALRENVRRTDIDYEPGDYEVKGLLVEGDRSAVRWTSEWRHRATGRVQKMDMAHFLRWQNNLVVEMDEFFDNHCVTRTLDPLPESLDDLLSPRGPGMPREAIVALMTQMANFSAHPDMSLFQEAFDPDVVCEFVGDRTAISYAGRHRGVEALLNIIRRIGIEFEQLGHAEPDVVLVDGEYAATRRTVEWRHRGTGRRGLVELADFVRYRGGKMIELVEFRDSLALLQMQN